MRIQLEFAAETPAGPITVALPSSLGRAGTALVVREPATGTACRGQIVHDNLACLMVPAARAGRPVTLDIEPQPGEGKANIEARQESDKVAVLLGGRPFATLRYEADRARPIIWPVIGPSGLPMTRAWPMREDAPDDSRDHPHHQSIWVSHGDVNGVDFWSLAEGYGVQRLREISVAAGPVAVFCDANIDWTTQQGQRVLTERRQVVFWDQVGPLRFIDIHSRLEMTEGDVRFGDTKEGGICSVRVNSTMEEKRGQGVTLEKTGGYAGAPQRSEQGGRITNGFGAAGEDNCWGKPAPWCDYSGPVEGRTVGIAILDHPTNFRYPVTWHVRAYGLMTANPFGLSAFTGDASRSGSQTWRKGEAVEWHYRIVLHDGDAASAGIDRQWNLFASGPQVQVI